jgi:hypothetical protein
MNVHTLVNVKQEREWLCLTQIVDINLLQLTHRTQVSFVLFAPHRRFNIQDVIVVVFAWDDESLVKIVCHQEQVLGYINCVSCFLHPFSLKIICYRHLVEIEPVHFCAVELGQSIDRLDDFRVEHSLTVMQTDVRVCLHFFCDPIQNLTSETNVSLHSEIAGFHVPNFKLLVHDLSPLIDVIEVSPLTKDRLDRWAIFKLWNPLFFLTFWTFRCLNYIS